MRLAKMLNQLLTESARNHKELLVAGERLHADLKAQMAAHCAELKEHVSAVQAAASGPLAGREEPPGVTAIPKARKPRTAS